MKTVLRCLLLLRLIVFQLERCGSSGGHSSGEAPSHTPGGELSLLPDSDLIARFNEQRRSHRSTLPQRRDRRRECTHSRERLILFRDYTVQHDGLSLCQGLRFDRKALTGLQPPTQFQRSFRVALDPRFLESMQPNIRTH